MAKQSKVFGKTVNLTSYETAVTTRAHFNKFFDELEKLEEEGWDLDWPFVAIESEIVVLDNSTFSTLGSVERFNTIHFEIRGRK